MIFETFLAISLIKNQPAIIPHIQQPSIILAARSSSFSRSSFSSSYSRPSSYSSFSRPSSSYSRPSTSITRSSSGNIIINRQKSFTPTSKPVNVTRSSSGNVIINRQKGFAPTPKPVTVTKSSSGNVMITKERELSKPIIVPSTRTTVSTPSVPKPRTTYTPSPPVVRETYIERDNGILGNPFFWMWMSENNRNNNSQVIVKEAPAISDVQKTTTPTEPVKQSEAVRTIVKKDSHNPLREFATFSLGAGVTVLAMRKFSRM